MDIKKMKGSIKGIVIGLFFPAWAIMIELLIRRLGLSIESIIIIHRDNISLFIIDTAPLVLGIYSYFLSKSQNEMIEKNKLLDQVLQKLRVEISSKEELNYKLNGILNNSTTSYIILSEDGRIEYVNNATAYVYGSFEIAGKNIFEFEAIKDTRLEEVIKNSILGTQEYIESYAYRCRVSNEIKHLKINCLPLGQKSENHRNKVLIISTDKTKEQNLLVKVEEGYISLVTSLAGALDARDSYTRFHSKNVRVYVELMLNYIDIDSVQKRNIIIAAELHDIGKIGIPDRILRKEDKLTDYEYELMKKHCKIGSDLFTEIDDFKDISKIILYHHERPDGRGYPFGLKDKDIPLGSRLISIADCYDAMTTNRVYRPALQKNVARQELINGKGSQFDSDLVDLFISIEIDSI